MLWEETCSRCLTESGFIAGAANPCLFQHPTLQVQVVVHGDDFTALGTDEAIDEYTKILEGKFEVKVRGRIGVGTEMTEIKILNRILRLEEDGLSYEADPRHVDLLSHSLGLQNCASVKTPGVKPADTENEAPKGEEGEVFGEVIDVHGNVYSLTPPDSNEKIAAVTAARGTASSQPCLLYTSPSPRDGLLSRMPSSA